MTPPLPRPSTPRVLRLTLAAAAVSVALTGCTSSGYPADPGGTLDSISGATLRAGVFNVFDEKYAWWSDVRGLSRPAVGASPGTLDAFTQPGRNVGVSLSVRL